MRNKLLKIGHKFLLSSNSDEKIDIFHMHYGLRRCILIIYQIKLTYFFSIVLIPDNYALLGFNAQHVVTLHCQFRTVSIRLSVLFRNILGPDLILIMLTMSKEAKKERLKQRHDGNMQIVERMEVLKYIHYFIINSVREGFKKIS